jgi:DNA polymerase III alpha subunit
MSKKTPEVMTDARKHFVEGSAKNGISTKIADKRATLMEVDIACEKSFCRIIQK